MSHINEKVRDLNLFCDRAQNAELTSEAVVVGDISKSSLGIEGVLAVRHDLGSAVQLVLLGSNLRDTLKTHKI